KGRLSRGRALLRSRLTRRGVALSASSLLWALSGSRSEAAEVPAELLGRTLRQALESRFASHGGHSSSSSAPPSAGDIASPAPAPSAPNNEAPPPPPPKKSPRRPPADQFIAAAILLLAFLGSIFVGGFVSATAHGGRFPDI